MCAKYIHRLNIVMKCRMWKRTFISRNDTPLCRHVILCQCPSRYKDGTVCRMLILCAILWSALTYLNEQEIMSGSIATCHFMYTNVSLVDCCYWHVGWSVVYSFCATYLLITDQFRLDFIWLSTLFNSFTISWAVKAICGLFNDRNYALPCRRIKRRRSIYTVQHRKCLFQC